MKNYFKNKLLISSSQCDRNSNLRFDSVLNIFQDLTTEHSKSMGTERDTLFKKSNAFWVLSKVKFRIEGKVMVSEYVNGKTWPYEPSAYRFLRENEVASKNGTIRGIAEWCVLDADTLAPRKSDSIIYPRKLKYLKPIYLESFTRFNNKLEESDYVYTYKVAYTDIDLNGHVNNVSYSKMALNVFSPEELEEYGFTAFEIHFLAQTYFNYEIKIYKKETENGVYIEGRYNDKAVFKTLFTK